MKSRIGQLRKLRGKSLREIRIRGAQEFAKLNERILGAGSSEMNDAELLREISRASRNGNRAGQLEEIASFHDYLFWAANHAAIASISASL